MNVQQLYQLQLNTIQFPPPIAAGETFLKQWSTKLQDGFLLTKGTGPD